MKRKTTIDDSATIRQVVGLTLRDAGYEACGRRAVMSLTRRRFIPGGG